MVEQRTIYGTLEVLATHGAVQLADAALLVKRYSDSLLVVTEEAGKLLGERVAL